jgi:hypothetical protein
MERFRNPAGEPAHPGGSEDVAVASNTGVSRSWGRASLAARQGVVDCLETRPRRGHALVTLKRYPMGL